MKRVLIIPAAGLGSRLDSEISKVMYPVNGRPMLNYLFDLYAPVVNRFVLVLHPATVDQVRQHCSTLRLPVDFEVQTSPTGMLDAILIPHDRIRAYDPDQVWVTWCDQIGVHPQTVWRLADAAAETDLAMPTIIKPEPYIHFDRNSQGAIAGLRQRREGDAMPEQGEGDLGLFSLSRAAYLNLLPQFSEQVTVGSATKERNFLPFIPWLSERGARVQTFPAFTEMESVGINTKADLKLVASYLANRNQHGQQHQQTFRHHPGL